ncbi:MAG: glucose-1-phosphate cytidylyltransferase [Actinobacteria bacterium]|nr:glucose-1-phosphate cytidylyltransferase [Actinomycetota bacterium]
MKAVILAGGVGSRISEESHLRPKPMIEVGGRPILWHIMKTFGTYGIDDFVICCGYKGYMIKEYFANYFLHMSDVTLDMTTNEMVVHQRHAEPWRVTLVDTGAETATGGRLKRISDYLDGTFCMTYGDGVSDINLQTLIDFHRSQGVLATVTAIQPAGRFGSIEISGARVSAFEEKPVGDGRWISGGYFVCEPDVLNLIENDTTVWERGPLERLAEIGQLSVWKHEGFWQSMDTLRDMQYLEQLWRQGEASWKVWD